MLADKAVNDLIDECGIAMPHVDQYSDINNVLFDLVAWQAREIKNLKAAIDKISS